MKKELTKTYILSNRGCYTREQTEQLSFMKKKKEPLLLDIVKSEISLKDKFWFVINKGELTTKQKQDLAISCAEIVLEIYESKYPHNKAPREAIQAAKDFLNGLITIEVLKLAYAADADAADAAYADATAAATYADAAAAAYATASAAYATAAAAYAAYAAAYAAYAADATYATYAAYAAAYAADATAAAAYADAKITVKNFTKLLLKLLVEFIKNN